MRQLFLVALHNRIPFCYVVIDSWFASKENFVFIRKYQKHFIAALKRNRLFAPSLEAKRQGRFVHVGSLELRDHEAIRGYLKGYEKEVLIVRRVFTNKDGSVATLDLVCSDLSLSGEQVAAIYQKRWKVEEYHKSLKSNAALGKSPTRRVVTQISHLVMSMVAFIKLESLKMKHHLNHFALKAKILLRAHFVAMQERQRLRGG